MSRTAILSAALVALVAATAAAEGRYPRPTLAPLMAEARGEPTLAQADIEKAASAPAPVSGDFAYRLAIDGVEGALEERLRDISLLKTKEDQPPAGRAGLLRRVEDDLERFAAALKAEGYYAYTLGHRIDFGQTPIRVGIQVESGPIYTLAAFEIVYDAPDAPGLIADPARVGVTVGAPARAEPIAEAPPHLIRQLGEAGYPLAKLKRRTATVDHASRTMRVRLEVAEGPRVVFGATKVSGLDQVDLKYVIRVADLSPGEHFNLARVDAARRRLFATGLFEGLQLTWADAPDDIGRLDVHIEAREHKRRTLSLGLNYSTTEGAGGDVEWTHRNLFHKDEDLTLTFRAAQLQQSARTELAVPNFRRLDQRAFLAGEVARADTDAFEERRASAELGLSRPYGARWRLGGGGQLSILETIENGLSENNIVLAAPFFALYDASNDPFEPTKGYKLDFHLEPAAITLDTTDLLATLFAGGSVYQRLSSDESVIAAARAKAGVILGPAIDRIPAGRRLFAGGGGSVRGYEFQSVSPLDAAGDPDGGRSLVEFGAEIRWRLTEDIGLVPFIDGGGAFADTVPDFTGLQFAAGLGLRYYTPIGPLRLDIAFPLNPRGRDNLFEVYISLGQAF